MDMDGIDVLSFWLLTSTIGHITVLSFINSGQEIQNVSQGWNMIQTVDKKVSIRVQKFITSFVPTAMTFWNLQIM